MRVLYFADIRFPLERANGIQTMETCYALAERGHSVSLVVKRDTHTPARDPFAFYGLTPHEKLYIERANAPAGAGILARTGYLSFALGRALGKARTDVIMTRDLGVADFLLRLPSGLRAPLIYESHGFAPDVSTALPDLVPNARRPSGAKLKRLRSRELAVWRGADGYVAITRGIVDHMTAIGGARARTAIVPDGMRLVPKDPGPLPREPVIGYAGHLYAWKGVDAILRALPLLPAARAVIVGGHDQEPDLERVKALARELGVDTRVTFTGLVEPARVPALLAQAMVLILPNPASAISTHFTSPLKLFEYMAAGRAIVASDLPAIREILRDGETALLVEPADPRAIASAVQRLIEDPAFAAALARAAHARAADFTWARRAERLEALFDEVVTA
jgi:glycosyltransferase involved in cell wall biosynthesis